MKKILAGSLFLSVLGFAGTADLVQEQTVIRHFTEVVETPAPVREKIQTSHAWRLQGNDGLGSVELSKELDGVGVLLDKFVNLGKKMWAVLENGKPAVNVKYQYANALPAGVARADQLENFSPLQFRSVRHYGVNLYGVTVYDVTYTLVHRFGGQFEGRGAYLENVTVLPQNVNVLWGYRVDLNVEHVSTVNTGTRENPVASMALETTLNVSTVMQESRVKNLHEFRGDRAEVNSTEIQ